MNIKTELLYDLSINSMLQDKNINVEIINNLNLNMVIKSEDN